MTKRYIIYFSLLAAVAATGLIFAGCNKKLTDVSRYNPLSEGKDTLRIYSLLPDTGFYYRNGLNVYGYQLYVNDSLIPYTGANTRGQITYGLPAFLKIPESGGKFLLKIVRYISNSDTPKVKDPDPARVLYETSVELPPANGTNNLVFYDDNGKISSVLLRARIADPGAPAQGKFKIRLVNFGYDMSFASQSGLLNSAGRKFEVSMQYADSTDVSGTGKIPFGTVSDYVEMDYGTWQFLLHNNTDNKYITNSGRLNDVQPVFNIVVAGYGNGVYYNTLFPGLSYAGAQGTTTQNGNVGSYPFAPGGCYTVMVIGNIYSVSLDRAYGDGILDNVGKVQVVNTNPNQQSVDVNISYAGKSVSLPSLRFGQYSHPLTVPAGDVTVRFSSGGATLYSYNMQAYPLSNISCYYLSDLKGVPFVLPVSNAIDSLDYIPGDLYKPAILEICHIGVLNLSPDAGNIFFTSQNLATDPETSLTGDVVYKSLVSNNRKNFDGVAPPVFFAAHLSTSRTDSLAARQVAVLAPPFHSSPAPGTYTMAAAGLFNTDDTAKKVRLVMIKHSNFISK
ncbi:MAG: DUF4397 domain-containing protein [Chitinophagaceae bacterium]|nr:DUF4397 domain-containing protein [Chitinophagaceae bacterium]